MRNTSLIFFHNNRAALKLENFASLLQGRQRHNVTGQNACSLPAAAPCGWGFKIHLSVSQWPQTQLGGCGGGGSAKCHREEHLLACPTARAWREGKEPGWCGQRRPLRRRHLQLRGPGDPAANLRSGRGLGRGRAVHQPGLLHAIQPWKRVRPPPPGPACILKNVRKEIYRFPPSSLFGCVCCDWKSFSSTWLRLSLPLCAPLLISPLCK